MGHRHFQIREISGKYLSTENMYCGYSLEAPDRGTSNEYQEHVSMEKKEKYQPFFFFFFFLNALSGEVFMEKCENICLTTTVV